MIVLVGHGTADTRDHALFGSEFLRRPGAVNAGCGYRTRRSMASQDAWKFAHQTCGRLWKKIGRGMLVSTIPAALLSLGCSVERMAMWSLGIVSLQMVAMLATIIPIERALKQNFDQFGRKR